MAIKFVSYLRKSSDMLYIKELTGKFVDSVKTIANFRFVKVGQTKAYLGNQRHLHLNATNKCNLEDLSDMLSLAHPFDIRYKLTDHIVRKQILDDHKSVKAIDKLFAKNAFGMSDGFTEILMFPAEWSTDKIVKTVTSSYNKLMNSDVTKFIKNTEREDEYNKNKNEYIVPTSIAQLMWNDVDVSNKTVLIIRQFPDWFIDRICREAKHVVYFIDNNNASMDIPNYDNLELILCDSIDTKYKNELEEYLENMNDKFDLVIANPPYSIGGKVISEAMKHCDEAVVLMPASKYRKDKLYQCVEDCYSVDPTMFDDAAISDNLCIAKLGNRDVSKTYSEAIESKVVDQNFKLFYDKNRVSEHESLNIFTDGYFPIEYTDTIKPYWFCLTARTAQDGVHKTTSCADYRWNILHDTDWHHYHIYTYAGKQLLTIGFLQFNSWVEHKNFSDFWYRGELSHKLMKGLRKSSGKMNEAIPKIDWSKTDVEYTDEYVLAQMGLKWNETKTGVELV